MQATDNPLLSGGIGARMARHWRGVIPAAYDTRQPPAATSANLISRAPVEALQQARLARLTA